MAYRPLKEPTDENIAKGIFQPNEIAYTLTRKINDALNYLYSLASTNTGKVKNSITTDEDGKAQLVNDLSDSEILPELVYGTDSSGKRGYKVDRGGYIGTKQVEEAGLDNGYILYYDEAVGKWRVKELIIPPQSGKKIISFPYKLWRETLGVVFTGYTDIQLQVSTNIGFTNIVKDVNSNSVNRADFNFFSATEGIYKAWMDTGVPATDILDIIYTGDLDFTSDVYLRWRMIEHNTENYGEWIPGGIMK